MASSNHNLSQYNKDEVPSGKNYKFGIVISEWNDKITFSMREACIDSLVKHDVNIENIEIIHVPGTFELTSGAKFLLSNGSFDAVVCIGCVIKGETKHDEYINQAVANGLTQLGLMANTACIFCVLTTNNLAQAEDRAGGEHGNKGVEAAITALKMAALKYKFKSEKVKIGFN